MSKRGSKTIRMVLEMFLGAELGVDVSFPISGMAKNVDYRRLKSPICKQCN